MKAKKFLFLGLMIGGALALPSMSRAAINKGIEGSPHDFSTRSWNTSRKGVCSACHAAHNTDASQTAPLWSHETSKSAFTPYTSPTMQAVDKGSLPTGPSLACLSCHDGSLAINQGIGGVTNASSEFIDPGAMVGPDLHTTHPISFTYDSTLAVNDGGLEDPITYQIGSPKTALTISQAPVPATGWSGTSLDAKTIDQALLVGHKMECSSCHDVHKLDGSAPESGILIRISGTDASGRGSLICRTCHIK